MNLKQKAITGFEWQLMNFAFQAVMNMAFLMVMARLIDKNSFGVFAIATVFIQLITMFSEIGIGAALVQRESYNKKHLSFAFYSMLFIGIILYFVVYFSAPLIVNFYNNQFSEHILKIIGLNVLVVSSGVVSKSLMLRYMNFKKIFFTETISYFTGKIAVGIYLAYSGFGINALIYSSLLFGFLSVVLSFILQPHSLKFNFGKVEAKEILHYGTGLTLTKFLHYISNESDKLIIGKYLNTHILGLYERTTAIVYLPSNYIGNILDGLIFSGVSRAGSQEQERNMFLKPLGLVSLVIVYITIMFIFYADGLIMAVLGEKWLDGILVFKIFSFLLLLKIFVRLSDALVRAKGAVYRSSAIKFVYTILCVTATLFGLRWGLEGVALFLVVAYSLYCILMLSLSLYLLQVPWSRFFSTIAPALVLAAILFIKKFILISTLKYFGFSGIAILSVGVSSDLLLLFIILLYAPKIYGLENLKFLIQLAEGATLQNKFLDFFIEKLKKALAKF